MKTNVVVKALRSRDVAQVIALMQTCSLEELKACKADVVTEILDAMRETDNLKQEYDEAKNYHADMIKYGSCTDRFNAQKAVNEVGNAYDAARTTYGFYRWQFHRLYAPDDYPMTRCYWNEYINGKLA